MNIIEQSIIKKKDFILSVKLNDQPIYLRVMHLCQNSIEKLN